MARIFLLISVLLLLVVPLILVAILPWQQRYKIYQFFYKILCKILNLQIVVRGEIGAHKPLVFVANHTSYLDIVLLGAAIPASFVSKAEVAKWPIVGQIGKFTGTLFIKRDRKLADVHVEQMREALGSGANLIFFPEGTTGDGMRVLPFKTSLFKLFEKHKVWLQPITVRYSHINGLPAHRNEKTLTAWVGDTSLKPHLSQLLRLGTVRVEIILHQPIAPQHGEIDRKILAKQCEEIVDSAL